MKETWRHRLRRNAAVICITVGLFLAVVAVTMDKADRREETWF